MSGITRPVASGAHTEAVERLVDSYSHIAPGQTVRLAKPTSNLFRGREGVVSGLDVSGLRGVLSVDPVARTARVQGMCTYEDLVDATLPYGLIPLVVPQLRTITLVPPRVAARIGDRDGCAHRLGGGGHRSARQ